ncbi:uncharacterized protein LOC119445919 isoform X2 [Dermacentor silvarum]|uniref:uncharacterized protein LOC119445919 isoform X2 n=1 Tax=Dermacentor silvarum TaxID=543639 RepID=UPI002100B961|nr:uncharacterized protein LOC119445919 isoform X2 [Dermacentor silvarum]
MSSSATNSLLNLLQISDSAFPTGSFAHSAGLEVAYQRGFLTTSEKVEKFLLASVENVGSFSVPFVREAYKLWTDLGAIRALDRLLNASLSNHIANRSSTQQGRSLIQTACATYKDTKLTEIQNWIYDGKLIGHQGQRMQFMLQSRIPEVMERHQHRTSESAANVYPLIDVMQSSHDQLFARMFYS